MARIGNWLTIVLALTSIVTAIRAYPNYFSYLNILSMGRPGYTLVNDSNLDWNQALPEVESFVRQHGLKQILLEGYGVSEPAAYVPQAVPWDCQQPADRDGGQWAVISANYMVDSGNCIWLLHYPHQVLAGGSMYAVQLPDVIPAAGQPDGPPLPADYHYFAGMHQRRCRPAFDFLELYSRSAATAADHGPHAGDDGELPHEEP